jgi:fructose-specific phosphotransferase system IIC component
MNPVVFGIIAGLVFGAVDVGLMLPMEFPDKKTALLGAFLSRFAIGFLIPLVKMPLPTWAIGGVVGVLVSLPDAVITKAYAPILGTGLLGGLLIGWAAGRFVA